MELETYRVFTAEQDFKYAAETFLQGQARKWLSQVLRQRLPDTSLATILMSGCVLGRVADIVLAHVYRRSHRHTRIMPQEFGERRYSAMLDDLNRFQEACKALGLRQDDLVATSDVLAGKNVAATCHALWSLAAACVEQGVKAIPEFASREEQAQLRADSMSRTRSHEKAARLSSVIAEALQQKPKKSNLSRELYLEHIPAATKPPGTDSAYSSPTGKEKDSVFSVVLDDVPALSPTHSSHSDHSANELAVATPPVSDARPRPPSAGSRPSSAGFRLPPRNGRPGSASSTCSSASSSGLTTLLGLKLPVPVEVTRQAWAVDCSSYKGLPLRPQPIMRPRTPDISKVQAKRRGFLGGCRDALPGLAGSIIVIAAMVLIGRGGSAPTETTNMSNSQEEEVAATREDQLWVVGRA